MLGVSPAANASCRLTIPRTSPTKWMRSIIILRNNTNNHPGIGIVLGTNGIIRWRPQSPPRPPRLLLLRLSLRILSDARFEHRGSRRGARGTGTITRIGTPAATGIHAATTTTIRSDHHYKSFPSLAYHRRPRSSPPLMRPPRRPPPFPPAVHDDDDDNVRRRTLIVVMVMMGSSPATIARGDENKEDACSRCSVQYSGRVPPAKKK